MAAAPEGDMFIVGTFSSVDPVTKVLKIQKGPEINLTEFIRGMKFPRRLLKKTPPKNRPSRRRTDTTIRKVPAGGNASQALPNTNPNVTYVTSASNETTFVRTQDQSLTQRNQVPARSPQLRTIYSNSVPAPPASLEISSDESMLQTALEMSLEDSVPSVTIADFHPQVPNFSTMSEDEQISYALKMSMQVNEHDYPIPV